MPVKTLRDIEMEQRTPVVYPSVAPVVELGAPELPVTGDSARREVCRPASSACVESDVELELHREALRTAATLRRKAFKMYLTGSSPESILKALAAPEVTIDTLIAWSRDGEWAMRLCNRNNANEMLVRENLRAIRLETAAEDAESSIKLGRKVRSAVMKKLENADSLKPFDLKNLADAGKASVDTTAHGQGVSEQQNAAAAAQEGRRPLVIVFGGDGMPPMPPSKQPKTVDVEEVK